MMSPPKRTPLNSLFLVSVAIAASTTFISIKPTCAWCSVNTKYPAVFAKNNKQHPECFSMFGHPSNGNRCISSSSTSISKTRLNASSAKNAEEWQTVGNEIITNAAMEAGAKEEQILIEWKADKIIVTLDSDAVFVSTGKKGETDDDVEIEYDEEIEGEDDIVSGEEEGVKESDDEGDEATKGLDISAIGRAINAALGAEGEDSIGYQIAVLHSVEVTTPGASNEISGDVMFEAYKGFGVIVETVDAKTGKRKKVEGKLVDRDEKVMTLNVKGRFRKIKNYTVESVKLPKAKTEKGVR